MSKLSPAELAAEIRKEKGKVDSGLWSFELSHTLHAHADMIADMLERFQSRHDYGPASPGEQEFGWQQYCARSGWSPDSHPAAKNAYIEGYCDGDSYSEGEEGRAVLRREIADALEENVRLRANRSLEALNLEAQIKIAQDALAEWKAGGKA